LGDVFLNSEGIIQVFNSIGEIVYSQVIKNNNSFVLINTEELSKGVYVVKIQSDMKTFTERIVKK